ncbi:MAG TPA: ATP-binding protein [Gemmatimonadaceae bacterium]
MSTPTPFDPFEALFAQSPNSTVLYDREGHPIAVNAAFERLWGASLAQVPPGYSVLHDEQLVAILPAIRAAFAGEAVRTPPVRYDVSAVTGAGRTLWTEAQLYPLRDAAGGVRQVVLVHHDVTARMEEQEHLRTTNVDLTTTNEYLVQQQAELQERMAEVQELALELQESNEQLQATMAELEDARDLAERSEEAARLAGERHRALVETSTAMVWTTTPEGQVEDMPFWRALTGQSLAEVRGHGWADAIHPEDRDAVVRSWRAAVGAGERYEAEYRVRTRDGSFRWFRSRAVPIRNPDGTLREWAGVFDDINDDMREAIRREFLAEAGRILGESLDYERTLREVAALAVPDLADWCAVDMLEDPHDTGWPPRVRRLAVAHKDPAKVQWAQELHRRLPTDWTSATGLPKVLREGVTEFYPVVDPAMIEAAAQNDAHRAVLREIGFHAVLIVPLVARGRVLGAMTFAMTESGRRYSVEDRLLAEAFAARAAAAIDNARLLAEAVDARGAAEQAAARTARLQSVTAALSRALTPAAAVQAMVDEGLPALGAEECSVCLLSADGSSLALVQAAHIPETVADTMRQFPLTAGLPMSEAVLRKRPVLIRNADDMRQRYPGAVPRYEKVRAVAWLILPFLVEDRALGAAAFGFPEEREFAAEELALAEALVGQCAQALERARLYAEAQAASAAKSQFLATMSHELRTPLNAIAGHVQLLEMGLHGPLADAQREALARVSRAQRHLLGLINDVLNFARLEAGRVTYDAREMLVRDVVADIVSMIEPQLAAKGIHFAMQMPDRLSTDPAPVRADPEKVGQVLLNLLSNAVKFTPEGGCVAISMRLSPTRDDLVLVDVCDSGIGIPPEKLERIFDPFVQVVTDAANRREGTGLGLAISRELARGMGGDITVSSTPGHGSRFTMALPRHRG